jgi:hypothetical protein
MFQSVKNTEIFATNEPSNLLCVTLPYKYLGDVKLTGDDRYLVFSGDEDNSEIGIANLENCTYQKIANNPCLNFSKNYNIIKGFLRVNEFGEEEIIFVDGYNKDRIINLSKIPYTYKIDEDSECLTKEYTNILDCEELLLNPKIEIPVLEIEKGNSGNLPDGVYSIAVAYLIDEVRFTDYYSASIPIQINNQSGSNSLEITLSNLDRSFEKYQVLLTTTVKGVTTHKIVGKYFTSQTSVSISDYINDEYQEGIPSTELTNSRVIYENTGILGANSTYLLRGDVTRKPIINYQPQAFNIEVEYVVKQVPLSYYKTKGKDIGYFRDENYNFLIRWYYNEGDYTEHFHIAGPKPNSFDLSIATGDDVFEIDNNEKDCKQKDKVFNYEVYNTAGNLIQIESDFICEERIIGYGATGYFASTEKYPDNEEIFGENACTNIRYHKMPDESKVPRYSVINEEVYINILGVRFKNIEHPKDKKGNYLSNISHYEILRSERDNANATVISRGVVTNMGGYNDNRNREILYSNFPFNSLEPNSYLSKKPTFNKNGKERDFTPLDKFYNNKFTYYTPFGNYFGRYKINGYLQFETEEIGTSNGYFEETYKHPKHKLLTNFSLLISLVGGAIEYYTLSMGHTRVTFNQNGVDIAGRTSGTTIKGSSNTITSVYPTQSYTVEESIYRFPDYAEELKHKKGFRFATTTLVLALKTLVSLGLFLVGAAKHAKELLEIIYNFSEYIQYAKQYNAETFYNRQRPINKGQKRRTFLRQPFYLETNGVHSVGNLQINNGGRNNSIFIELKKEVPFPSTLDTSRKTASELKVENNTIATTTSSLYYVTNKQNNPNQYGTLEGVKPIKTHTNPIKVELTLSNKEAVPYESGIIFGGDCIIAEQTHINKFPIFKQDLANANFIDGVAYDYRLYNNVGYARYWFDSTEYDMAGLVNIFGRNNRNPNMQKLPSQKYNLDGVGAGKNKFIQTNAYIYTSVNGVIRYIVEVPYNISYRKSDEEGTGANLYQPHYSENQSDLSFIFRTDVIKKPENFLLDPSYRYIEQKYIFSQQLIKILNQPIREKNTVLYSLPSSNSQLFNNWRYFLPLNRFNFDERDFGTLTGIHAIEQDRIMFLFDKASPFLSLGVDELKTESGKNVTIGDGGFFARKPEEIIHTDVAYGSNHDRYAFRATQYGYFYVSEKQGKLFNYTGKLEEYSNEGWDKWCANYVPLNLKKEFPNYRHAHNYIGGVGYQIAFDNMFTTVYICKKDFSKLDDNVTYNEEEDQFYYNGILKIDLGDPLYFEDCSFTLSYNTELKSFQSFHDWHPDGIIQEEKHFSTVKDNKIWKHNIRHDSFCNFYDKDYMYELGVGISTGQNPMMLLAVEYMQEAYTYKTNQLDRYHVYNETFNKAIISNSEQLSGILELKDATNLRYAHTEFPKFKGNYSVEIPFTKNENKFRFNMFYDYTKNRGRNNNLEIQPFITKKNGYIRTINPSYIDFNQPRPPRFRHYFHEILLQRDVSKSINFITKFNNSKMLLSAR